jgi:ribosomal protein S18 acetylase RimI-like enzyme
MLADEVEAVAELARVVWQAAYADIVSPAQRDYMLAQRYGAERMRVELASGRVWWDVAEQAGTLVAFASCQLTETPGEMQLDKLYVHPRWQRQGLGGRLIACAEGRALTQGCDTLVLAVNKRNAPAIAAYRKHGFAVRAAVVKAIGGGFVMDDYIMEKRLLPRDPACPSKTPLPPRGANS